MMSSELLSMKPAAAAAHPEYELSMETTTGMSPPPIAATRWSPSASATTVMSRSAIHDSAEPSSTRRRTTMRRALTTSAPRLSQLRPGSVRGAPLIRAESLR